MEDSYFYEGDHEAPKDQNIPTDLDQDLSQNLHYSAAERKFTDEIIKTQLKQWLFDHFAT